MANPRPDSNPPLDERETLAQHGALTITTTDGVEVPPTEAYTCPYLCGEVFSTADAHESFCGAANCSLQKSRLRAMVDAVAPEGCYTVYMLYDIDGKLLKVDFSLKYSNERWWWRNVKAIGVAHYTSEETAMAVVQEMRRGLHPIYDVDPDALGEPRPLESRVPKLPEGPNNLLLSLRISEDLDEAICSTADAEGETKNSWIRKALWALAHKK